MARPYHTLLSRETILNEDGSVTYRWHPQFGDYDKDTVVDEQLDFIRTYEPGRVRTRIITTQSSRQRQIDEAIKNLDGVA